MKHIKKFESKLNDITEDSQCFVFVQGNDINIEHFYELVRKSKNDELILYPERGMTFANTVDYKPYVKPIVTENPYIIACYDSRSVWVLQEDEWVNPDRQTYGASVNLITTSILQYPNTIPILPYGGRSFESRIKNMKNYND